MTDVGRRRAAFVGLGRMGLPIAANLAASGLALHCYDLDPARVRQLAEAHGCAAAGSVEQCVAAADLVFTCLPTTAEVAAVVEVLLAAPLPGSLLVDLTSGDPATTRALAGSLAEHGVRLVDAPVSGGVERAVSGDLAVMLGGAPDDLDEAERLLAPAAARFFRCGSVGSGQAMKALNNLVSATGLLVAAEALCIGRGLGLDPDVMVGVLNASTGSNNATRNKIRQFVLSGSYDSGFALDLMVKDLSIALGIAGDGGAPVSAAVLEQWRAAQSLLGPGRDHTEVARWAEHLSGVPLGSGAAVRGTEP